MNKGFSVAHADSSRSYLEPTLEPSPVPAPSTHSGAESAESYAPEPLRILLAMAAELDRMAWSIVINNQKEMELVAAASSSRQLARLLKSHNPHVVLLDEELLNLSDHAALLAFARKTSCRFVLVAMHQPDYSLEHARVPFIHARLLKGVSAPDLLETVRAVAGVRRRINAEDESA
jgi:DNA-binding NarL/FixJ family response regulator